jgi:signal transduction histidine kinase
MRFVTAQTLEELRRLSIDLRPAALDNLGLVPVLQWYIKQCSQRTGLSIQFMGDGTSKRLDPDIELALYRVVQEGLTNAIRHSNAQHIEVVLERSPRAVWLTITDDGCGFDPKQHEHGLGLIGIRERVHVLDGIFSIDTAPGAGTRLLVEVPYGRQTRHDN